MKAYSATPSRFSALPATVANPLMSIPLNQFETRGSSWKMAAISSPNWSILRFRRSCTLCGNWNYQNQHSELQNLKRKQQQVSEEVGTHCELKIENLIVTVIFLPLPPYAAARKDRQKKLRAMDLHQKKKKEPKAKSERCPSLCRNGSAIGDK